MSSNPDQIPKSPSTNIPHSGEYVSPDALPIEAGIPAPDTAYEGFEGLPPRIEERPVFDQGKAAVRDSHLAPTTPETKSNRGLKVALAAGAATVAAALGAWGFSVGASGNGLVQNPNTNNTPPPAPETVNTAPVTPGAVAPTPTFEAPAQPKTVTSKDIASYESNVASTVLTAGEHKGSIAALHAFIPRIESMVNYQPSDDELEASKNFISPKTGATGPAAALEMYQASFDGLFSGPSQFKDSMYKLSTNTFNKWLADKQAGEAEETQFETKLKLDENNRLVVTNNDENNPTGTVYTLTPEFRLDNLSSENQDPEKRQWRLQSAILTKYGEVPNNK